MSSRYGIRYSWYVGFDPDVGRYRFTRNTTSRSAISVLPLDGLPLRDLHRYVIDPRCAVGAIRERVLQVVRVVAVREVRPAVGAARLPSVQRAVGDRRRGTPPSAAPLARPFREDTRPSASRVVPPRGHTTRRTRGIRSGCSTQGGSRH